MKLSICFQKQALALIAIMYVTLTACDQGPKVAQENYGKKDTAPNKEKIESVAKIIRDQSKLLASAIFRAEADDVKNTASSGVQDLVGLLLIPKYISDENLSPPIEVKGAFWQYTKELYALKVNDSDIGTLSADDVLIIDLEKNTLTKELCLAINSKIKAGKPSPKDIPTFDWGIGTLDFKNEENEGCGVMGDKYAYYRIINVR